MIRAALVFLFACGWISTAEAENWLGSIFDDADPKIVAEVKAHPDLLQEAQTYTGPCFMQPKDSQELCAQNERQFIESYIGAYYNDHMSMSNVVAYLADVAEFSASNKGFDSDVGVEAVPIQGCAWELTLINSGSAGSSDIDALELPRICGSLSDFDKKLAERRSEVIIKGIENHVARGDTPTEIIYDNGGG